MLCSLKAPSLSGRGLKHACRRTSYLSWVPRDIQQKANQLDSKQQASAAVICADHTDDMVLQDVTRAGLSQRWQSVRKEASELQTKLAEQQDMDMWTACLAVDPYSNHLLFQGCFTNLEHERHEGLGLEGHEGLGLEGHDGFGVGGHEGLGLEGHDGFDVGGHGGLGLEGHDGFGLGGHEGLGFEGMF